MSLRRTSDAISGKHGACVRLRSVRSRRNRPECATDSGMSMPGIPAREFERVPLRVHSFLVGVPLHDVWAVDLPRIRAGITLDDFLRSAGASPFRPSPIVRALLGIRFFVGRLLGWDREPAATTTATFASRLTTADRSASLAPAGSSQGFFRVVYRLEN